MHLSLSRLRINSAHKQAWHTLSDAYHLHAAVMSGFPDYVTPADETAIADQGRVLFRQEPSGSYQSPYAQAIVDILVQGPADITPQWQGLQTTLAGAVADIQTKPISLTFVQGQQFRFRLRGNARSNARVNEGKHKGLLGEAAQHKRKRKGLLGETAQREWLTQRAQENGFILQHFTARDEGFLTARKRESKDTVSAGSQPDKYHNIALLTVLYEGILQVEQPAAFLTAIKRGIGGGKGLGCGLLSIGRC